MNRDARRKTQDSRLNLLVPPLLDWFARNARDLPWRRTRDPYAIWISEIMLQQTQVRTVIPYWERWRRELPTVQALARAKPEKVLKLWEGLGYYTRARNLQRAAKFIVEQHGGRFPRTFDRILALPGVGRYTAGAICSIAFNQPTPVLDGNVIRVLTRVFGIGGNPREKQTNARLWTLAATLVEDSRLKTQDSKLRCSDLNQSLMELGAVICTPRRPNCPACPVRSLCVAYRTGATEALPRLGKRGAGIARRFIAFVVRHRGRYLVRQRPAGVVNARLWEFPNVEIGARHSGPQQARLRNPDRQVPASGSPRTHCGSGDPRAEAASLIDLDLGSITSVCTIKHSITRYRITLDAYRADLAGPIPPRNRSEKWLTPAKLNALAFTSAHRKILAQLETTAKPCG